MNRPSLTCPTWCARGDDCDGYHWSAPFGTFVHAETPSQCVTVELTQCAIEGDPATLVIEVHADSIIHESLITLSLGDGPDLVSAIQRALSAASNGGGT